MIYLPCMRPHRHPLERLAGVLFAIALWSGATVTPVSAADPHAPGSADRTLYKTGTYQGLSSLNDFLFGMAFGDGMVAGGILAAASLVIEPVVYYSHEKVWENSSPGSSAKEDMIAAKTATYTAVNAGRIFSTGMLLTGSPVTAAGFVAFNAVGDSLSYVANEALWSYLWPLPHGAEELLDEAAP